MDDLISNKLRAGYSFIIIGDDILFAVGLNGRNRIYSNREKQQVVLDDRILDFMVENNVDIKVYSWGTQNIQGTEIKYNNENVKISHRNNFDTDIDFHVAGYSKGAFIKAVDIQIEHLQEVFSPWCIYQKKSEEAISTQKETVTITNTINRRRR